MSTYSVHIAVGDKAALVVIGVDRECRDAGAHVPLHNHVTALDWNHSHLLNYPQ